MVFQTIPQNVYQMDVLLEGNTIWWQFYLVNPEGSEGYVTRYLELDHPVDYYSFDWRSWYGETDVAGHSVH